MSLIDMADMPISLFDGLSTTPINHLRIPEEEFAFPEFAYSYCIETFVIDLQWANFGIPVTREECQAAWFAYLEREWNKYQDAEYVPPEDGVTVPSENELREQLDVMIAGAFKTNWRTDAERAASKARREARRRLRRYSERAVISDEIAKAKKDAGITKSKVVKRSRAVRKKRRQDAAMVHQLEVALSQMDFEANSSITNTSAESADQPKKQPAEGEAKKPARTIDADPKRTNEHGSRIMFIGCTGDMGEKEVQTAMAEDGMDVDI